MIVSMATSLSSSCHRERSRSANTRQQKEEESEMAPIRRDMAFPRYSVTITHRLDDVGSSLFFEAEEQSPEERASVSSSKKTFLIKATVAETEEQARRVKSEIRVLRSLPEHHNILRMIDTGCSTLDQPIGRPSVDEPLEEERLYCLLMKDCPSRSVKSIIKKHRRKLERSIFESNQRCGWIEERTVLETFRQMAVAISVLHNQTSLNSHNQSTTRTSIIHMDVRPDRFCAFKIPKANVSSCKYMVKLIGAGCAIDDRLRLLSIQDRNRAARLIDSNVSRRYRTPEMVNLLLADALTDKVDIWQLGCCLYGLLFLNDCFHDDLEILAGKYEIPCGHPYSHGLLELLSRLLAVEADLRPGIQEVISYIDYIMSGKSLPPRQTNHEGLPFTPLSLDESPSKTSTSLPRLSRALSGRSAVKLSMAWRDGSFDQNWSVSASETQWLEFAPNEAKGSCLRQLIEPATSNTSSAEPMIFQEYQPSTATLDSSQRSARSDVTEARMTEWTLGLINRMSTRDLLYVSDDSKDCDGNNKSKEHMAPLPRKPSSRAIHLQRKSKTLINSDEKQQISPMRFDQAQQSGSVRRRPSHSSQETLDSSQSSARSRLQDELEPVHSSPARPMHSPKELGQTNSNRMKSRPLSKDNS